MANALLVQSLLLTLLAGGPAMSSAMHAVAWLELEGDDAQRVHVRGPERRRRERLAELLHLQEAVHHLLDSSHLHVRADGAAALGEHWRGRAQPSEHRSAR